MFKLKSSGLCDKHARDCDIPVMIPAYVDESCLFSVMISVYHDQIFFFCS